MIKFTILSIAFLTFIVLIPLFTGCDDPFSSSPAETELEGIWVGYEDGGGTEEWTFTFTGRAARCTCSTGEWYNGNFAVDTTTDPKLLNISITQCPYSSYIGKISLVIYKITGDTLTYAANEPGAPARPTSFDPVGDTRVFVAIKK